MYDCFCECIQLLYAKKHTNTCSLLLIFLVAVQTTMLSTIPNHTQQSHFPPRSMKLTNTLCSACINLANEGENSTNESLSEIKTGSNPLFCIYQVFFLNTTHIIFIFYECYLVVYKLGDWSQVYRFLSIE